MENSAELVFVPAPGVGHLTPMVALAKALTVRDHRVSVTVFIMNHPSNTKLNSYVQTLLSNPPPPRVRFVHLSLDEATSEHLRSKPRGQIMFELVKIHTLRVREYLSSEAIAGFVVDLFCISFTEIATELKVPSYVFFTSGLGILSLMFYLQSLHDDKNCDILAFNDSEVESKIPGFVNPVPSRVLPSALFEKDSNGSFRFIGMSRNLRESKGILVNTFAELEHHAISCLSDDAGIPPIYAVGPVLNLNTDDMDDLGQYKVIMSWLDSQPAESVVFLCFGSMGTFDAEQVVEIAKALEKSEHRFLWSLRSPPPKGTTDPPRDYEDLNEVLPEGFLDRTKGIGKVIGWAPQVAVLSHPAVGGFVSHCGWNSTLESLWCGVPIATWPLYAEQTLNAFQMVIDLGLAVEIKLDYRKENPVMVSAEEIERGLNQLMEGSDSVEIRKKVKEMSEKSRTTMVENGSSYVSAGHFIEKVLNNSS